MVVYLISNDKGARIFSLFQFIVSLNFFDLEWEYAIILKYSGITVVNIYAQWTTRCVKGSLQYRTVCT